MISKLELMKNRLVIIAPSSSELKNSISKSEEIEIKDLNSRCNIEMRQDKPPIITKVYSDVWHDAIGAKIYY